MPLALFDALGVNVGAYMRLIWWCTKLFGAVSLISVLPVSINLLGNSAGDAVERLGFLGPVITYHTIGNAAELHWLHAASDLLISIVIFAALAAKQAEFRERWRGNNELLDVESYTLKIKGCASLRLPRSPPPPPPPPPHPPPPSPPPPPAGCHAP